MTVRRSGSATGGVCRFLVHLLLLLQQADELTVLLRLLVDLSLLLLQLFLLLLLLRDLLDEVLLPLSQLLSEKGRRSLLKLQWNRE